MELLERYLQAVRTFLPRKAQDDILHELSENILSQMDEREAELGRRLTGSGTGTGHQTARSSHRGCRSLRTPPIPDRSRIISHLLANSQAGTSDCAGVAIHYRHRNGAGQRRPNPPDPPGAVAGSRRHCPGVCVDYRCLHCIRVFRAADELALYHRLEPPIVARSRQAFGHHSAGRLRRTDHHDRRLHPLVAEHPDRPLSPLRAGSRGSCSCACLGSTALAHHSAGCGGTLLASVNLASPHWTVTRTRIRLALRAAAFVILLILVRAGTWVVVADGNRDPAQFSSVIAIVNQISFYGLLCAFVITGLQLAWEGVQHLRDPLAPPAVQCRQALRKS